jgi:hypothetical protein
MKTIGRHWPRGSAPRGDYPRPCDYCGVKWRFSQLTRMPWGLYACPDDLGDTRYAAAPRIPNNEGTGSSAPAAAPQTEVSDPLVIL